MIEESLIGSASERNLKSKTCTELSRSVQHHRRFLPTIENPKAAPQTKIQNVMVECLALLLLLAGWVQMPSISDRREFVANGGLMSYGSDEAESYKRVAYLIDRILKGAKPADIPVEQPTKFELLINLKAAKALGLTISPDVLSRAQKLIK